MNPTDVEERAFVEELSREVNELAGLKELEDWYLRRHREVWEPFNIELQRLQRDEGADTARPELRDRVAQELGVTRRSELLQTLYQQALGDLVGRAAEDLANPDSDAHHEIVEKYDEAWRELANR